MENTTYLYGIHAAHNALMKRTAHIRAIYIANTRHDRRLLSLIQLAKEKKLPVHEKDPSILTEWAGDPHHQGIVIALIKDPVVHLEEIPDLLEKSTRPPLLLLLDGIQDPHNLGACLRAAETAGVHAIIAPKDNACPLTATARKVASGAAEIVPLIYVTNLAQSIQFLQKQNIWIYGACERATETIYQHQLTGPVGIVMGAEGKGLRQLTRQRCDGLFSIPVQGEISSLNVSVATGVCLFEAVRQRIATGS